MASIKSSAIEIGLEVPPALTVMKLPAGDRCRIRKVWGAYRGHSAYRYLWRRSMACRADDGGYWAIGSDDNLDLERAVVAVKAAAHACATLTETIAGTLPQLLVEEVSLFRGKEVGTR